MAFERVELEYSSRLSGRNNHVFLFFFSVFCVNATFSAVFYF